MINSRQLFTGTALALSTLVASAGSAFAGGEVVYGSGVRHAGAAVPVPAPAPVPEVTTGWYIRIDAAYSQSDVSKYRSSPSRVDQVRGDSYLDNFPRYGLGLGMYLNKWLRADITIDQRNDATSSGSGSVDYTIANAGGPTSIRMRDTYRDSFTSSNSTGLINLYANLPVHQSFAPYIGGGLGYVRHQLKGRSFSRTTACIDTTDCDPGIGVDPASTAANSTGFVTAGGVNYQFAAALMAGFSYKMWENTQIDVGYRWLHLQGAQYTGRSSVGTVENLKIPDQNIHEMRVGLRYDIN